MYATLYKNFASMSTVIVHLHLLMRLFIVFYSYLRYNGAVIRHIKERERNHGKMLALQPQNR